MMPARSGSRKRIDPVLFLEIMDFLPVRAWQVIQNADDSLSILLGGAYAEIDIHALRNRLAHDLAAHDIIDIAIGVQKVNDIPKSANGKIQQINSYSEPDVQPTQMNPSQSL